MPSACVECRAAKRKCDGTIPCGRCIRLGRQLTCVPHESQQGRRKGKRKKQQQQHQHQHEEEEDVAQHIHAPVCDNTSTPTSTNASKFNEAAAMSQQLELLHKKSYGHHFGVLYLIRSWVSFAMSRRSFALLARASDAAVRCGISMDMVLNEHENTEHYQRGMDFLHGILLRPEAEQIVVGSTRLMYQELPESLCLATELTTNTNTNTDADVGERLIWVREMRKGVSRYYLTPAFERELASWSKMNETFQANEMPVVNLFLLASAPTTTVTATTTTVAKHTKAFAHQISLHPVPNTPPCVTRIGNLQLQTKEGEVWQVDQISCLVIRNLDHAFYYVEYVRNDINGNDNENDNKPQSPATAAVAAHRDSEEEEEEEEEEAYLKFLDLDDLSFDGDLENLMLDILK